MKCKNQNLIQICQQISQNNNKYNLATDPNYLIYADEIIEYTKDYVPDRFSVSKRIQFICDIESNETTLDRYYTECSVCDTKFFRSKGYGSTECNSCSKQKLKRCHTHNIIYTAQKGRICPQCSIEESHLKFTDKKSYEECRICGFRGADLSKHITNIHEVTTQEYKVKYNVKTLICEDALQFMSDRIKGENNPAYNHGGKYSPFSQNYMYGTENIEKVKAKAKLSRKLNNSDNTTVEYWLKKTNGNLEEAQELLRKRQSTFSLDKCIEKYGEELGKQRWLDRQEKWQKSYKKSNFSKISQELFWGIADKLNNLNTIHFAQLDENKQKDESGTNHEYKLKLEKVILPDFIDTSSNKIIEFDGVYWHGKVGHGNLEREKKRDLILQQNGYDVLHISENDYKNNKNDIIQKCIHFLTQ